MCSHPEIRTTYNLQVMDMNVSNYSIILGRDWQALTGGYYSMDGSHIIVPKGPKNIIIYQEERIVPYVENPPWSEINFVEIDLGVYSIFDETEEQSVNKSSDLVDNDIWYMHFDGASSKDGSGVGISLYNSFGKTFSFAFRLDFPCTNNKAEFEALILGLEKAHEAGCKKIIVFGDSELIINLVKKSYTPSNKLMRRYTTLACESAAKFLSFDISHVKRNL